MRLCTGRCVVRGQALAGGRPASAVGALEQLVPHLLGHLVEGLRCPAVLGPLALEEHEREPLARWHVAGPDGLAQPVEADVPVLVVQRLEDGVVVPHLLTKLAQLLPPAEPPLVDEPAELVETQEGAVGMNGERGAHADRCQHQFAGGISRSRGHFLALEQDIAVAAPVVENELDLDGAASWDVTA